jgi:hypothetical protein
MILRSTQPLAEINIKIFLGEGEVWPARKADNLTANCLEDVGISTSHTPMGHRGLLQDQLYLFLPPLHLHLFLLIIIISFSDVKGGT